MNTRYFHFVIKWRRSSHEINGLRENGQWLEEQETVKEKVKEFFKERFSGRAWQQVRIDNANFTCVLDEDNQRLTERITEKEIKNAMSSCESSKSPGPDGFNFGFIKFCWEEIKSNIITTVYDFEESGRWPRGTNASFYIFNPKSGEPLDFK